MFAETFKNQSVVVVGAYVPERKMGEWGVSILVLPNYRITSRLN